jgi:Mn2+/Fe2+ NRAMP family transporter
MINYFIIKLGNDLAKLCRKYYGEKTALLLWIMAEIAIIGI